jgi:hypothetical protein
MIDCLEIVRVLRSNGLEPTVVDIGLSRADFRLGVRFRDPYDIYYAGKCLNNYSLGVVVDKDYFYFSGLDVDAQVFAEIVGG